MDSVGEILVLAFDVKEVIDLSLAETDIDQVKVKNRPRLLPDSGAC